MSPKLHKRHAVDEQEPYDGLDLKKLDFGKPADLKRAFEKIKDWSGRMHDASWHTREALKDHLKSEHNIGDPPDKKEPPPDPPFDDG